MQVFASLLLFLGFISDAADFRLNLQNFVVTLRDKLLDSLKSLVTLLHAEKTLLPVLKKCLLAHDDALDLNGGLFEGVAGGSRFFLL